MNGETPIILTQSALKTLLEEASEAGANKALKAVGLNDAKAPHDVLELRGLLEAWRDAKATAWRTIIKTLTVAALAIAAAVTGKSLFFKD